eukprot:Phypoly_transcript_06238.p1 GENE.Phypoly_transcript_06238~~Phypoly_transcript_06238.p1  ORF type:complete len:442 (-),score=26.46 Phypoly_transcript_06238:478-1803(-)
MGGSQDDERALLINQPHRGKMVQCIPTTTVVLSGVVGYPKYYIPRRYIMVLLCFLATLVCYWLRTNMSLAIIPMSQEYVWSKKTQGLILSSFFWGYIMLQFPGSWIATRLGAKLVLGLGVLCTSLFTLLTPFAAFSVPLLLFCRFCTGFAEAVTYPVIAMLVSEWAATNERTVFITIIWCGGNLGTVISMLTTSPLITFFGWRALFYLNGCCGLVWALVWFAIAANQPHQMVGICDAEIKYIHAPTSTILPEGVTVDGKPRITFETIHMLLKSIHVWAIIIANFCCNWGFYVLLTWIPTFMHDELNFDISHAGFVAVIPYLGLFCFGIIAGRVADYMIKSGIELGLVRKTFGVLGCSLPALFLASLSFITEVSAAVVCMSLAVSLSGLTYSSYGPNILDIAPKYAGIIMGYAKKKKKKKKEKRKTRKNPTVSQSIPMLGIK